MWKPETTPIYRSPTLAVWHHSLGFLSDESFMSSYSQAMSGSRDFLDRLGAPADLRHEWPILVACWAAWHGSHLAGDFVECGTNTGLLSKAVCEYVDFNRLDKAFYLFDTYCGLPMEQMSAAERRKGRETLSRSVYGECFEATQATFAAYPRVQLVRGVVPESLSTVSIERVAYLSLDMNLVYPEIAALEYFWPRLSPGAPVLLDDYGKRKFLEQKRAMDHFACGRGLRILELPTGQGLLLKP